MFEQSNERTSIVRFNTVVSNTDSRYSLAIYEIRLPWNKTSQWTYSFNSEKFLESGNRTLVFVRILLIQMTLSLMKKDVILTHFFVFFKQCSIPQILMNVCENYWLKIYIMYSWFFVNWPQSNLNLIKSCLNRKW